MLFMQINRSIRITIRNKFNNVRNKQKIKLNKYLQLINIFLIVIGN